MMNKTALLLLAAAAMLTASACDESKKTPDPVSIRMRVATVSDDPASQIYRDAAERFHALHPDLSVAIEYATLEPGSQSTETNLVKLLRRDDPPDLVPVPLYKLPAVADRELLADLTPLQQSEGPQALDIPKPILDAATVDGKLLALPFAAFPNAVYFNKSLFDAAQEAYPAGEWTWERFRDLSRKLTAAGFGSVLAYDIWTLDLLMAGTGQGLLSPDGSTAVGYLDSPEAVRAVEWLNAYYRDDARKREAQSATDSFEQFADNHAAMIVGGAGAVFPNFTGDNKAMLGVAPLPHFAGGSRANPADLYGIGIARSSRHPNEAWKFLRYLALDVNEDSVRHASGFLATSAAISKASGQSDDPATRVFAEEMNVYKAPSLSNPYIFEAWTGDLQQAFDRLLKTSDADIQAGLHALAQQLDAELSLSRKEAESKETADRATMSSAS